MTRVGPVRVLLVVSGSCIVLLCLCAIAAPLISPFDPTDQHLEDRFARPGEHGYLLGTDNFGRDVLSRVIYGSRSALLVGLVSVAISLSLGLAFGLVAGLARGRVDQLLMLVMDAVLSFPTVLLAITVVTFLGYGLPQVMIAMGVIYSPVFARVVRAETLAIGEEGFIESSKALGTPVVRAVVLHYLPNMAGKLVVQSAVIFALSIVVESSLSYLGLGNQPPNPSWGLMLKDARNYLFTAPHLAVVPGVAIAVTVLSFNLFSDAVTELIDS